MSGHGEKLSRRHHAAIVALLEYGTIEEAARACEIGNATLRRWLQRPAFRAAFDAASRRVLSDAVGRLRALACKAVATLDRAMSGGAGTVEVRAAIALLDAAIKVEVDELARRVRLLEERYEAEQSH